MARQERVFRTRRDSLVSVHPIRSKRIKNGGWHGGVRFLDFASLRSKWLWFRQTFRLSDFRRWDGQISDIRLILRPGMYLSLTMDNMMVGDFSTSLEMTGGFARRSDYNWKVQNMSEKIVYCWFVKHMLHRAWWNHGVYLLEISIQAVALGSSYNLDNYIFWVVFWNLQKRRNNAWHKSVRYPCDDCVLLPHCVLGGKKGTNLFVLDA